MNNKNKNSIDQFFSEKLQNHSVKPRDLVWENLDKQLGKKKGKTSRKYWALGALFSVFILGAGGIFFINPSEAENQVREQKTETVILSEVQKTSKNNELIASSKTKENIEAIIVHKKEENKIQKNHSAIQTTIHTTKNKTINLSTKKENKTSKKQAVATLQTPVKKEEVVTGETTEIPNSEELEDVNKEEIQKTAKNDESEAENALETNTEKQETKKAGVHVTIRLGTQAGGRDEEREEIEAEEKANKKSRLLGKVLKGAWNLKKEKKLGKKNN